MSWFHRPAMDRNHTSSPPQTRIIDLSDVLSNDTSAFEPSPHAITYINHQQSYAAVPQYGLKQEYFTPGHAWAVENVTLSTHSGTHVDAPYHYGPTSGGQPAKTIDQLPLEWFLGDGVRIDMRHKLPGSGISADDLRQSLTTMHYTLKPFDIVLIWTGASAYFRNAGYEQKHSGLLVDATRFLVESGVKVIGIDAWGLDRPFDVMAQEAETGSPEHFWETHFYGIEQEYCQIEKLAHLDQIPADIGFKIACFPVKIESASGAWSRVVALVTE